MVVLQVIVVLSLMKAVTHMSSPHQLAPGKSFACAGRANADHKRSTRDVGRILVMPEDGG